MAARPGAGVSSASTCKRREASARNGHSDWSLSRFVPPLNTKAAGVESTARGTSCSCLLELSAGRYQVSWSTAGASSSSPSIGPTSIAQGCKGWSLSPCLAQLACTFLALPSRRSQTRRAKSSSTSGDDLGWPVSACQWAGRSGCGAADAGKLPASKPTRNAWSNSRPAASSTPSTCTCRPEEAACASESPASRRVRSSACARVMLGATVVMAVSSASTSRQRANATPSVADSPPPGHDTECRRAENRSAHWTGLAGSSSLSSSARRLMPAADLSAPAFFNR